MQLIFHFKPVSDNKKQFGSIHICIYRTFWDRLLSGTMFGKGLTCARFVQRYTLQCNERTHSIFTPTPVQVKQWVLACIQIRKRLMAFPAFIWLQNIFSCNTNPVFAFRPTSFTFKFITLYTQQTRCNMRRATVSFLSKTLNPKFSLKTQANKLCNDLHSCNGKATYWQVKQTHHTDLVHVTFSLRSTTPQHGGFLHTACKGKHCRLPQPKRKTQQINVASLRVLQTRNHGGINNSYASSDTCRSVPPSLCHLSPASGLKFHAREEAFWYPVAVIA